MHTYMLESVNQWFRNDRYVLVAVAWRTWREYHMSMSRDIGDDSTDWQILTELPNQKKNSHV